MGLTPIEIVVLVAVACIALVLFSRRGRTPRSGICKLFQLDPSKYQLLATDLGDGSKKIFLSGDGIVGVPDAIFLSSIDDRIVIGEAKTRRFLGQVTRYERYQVLLYLGLAMRKYRKSARGLIRYGCGTVVSVEWDQPTYVYLISQIPAYHQVAKNF